MKPVYVLSGPNLGRLGRREPEVYGRTTYDDLVATVRKEAADLGVPVEVRQTDDEATLVQWLHEAADEGAGVVVNPAAFTHYSYAVRDAIALVDVPVVEVHLSNVAKREPFRRESVVSAVVAGTITGFGVHSYTLGLRAVCALLAVPGGNADA